MRYSGWMSATLAIVVCAGLIAGCGGRKTSYVKADAAALTPEQQQLADAEAAWAQRDDKAQLETALAKWEAYLEHDPNNSQVLGMLARGYYLLGNGHAATEDEALTAYDTGASFGERGMAANDAFRKCVSGGTKDYKCLEHLGSDDMLPTYWVYANVGKWSATKGFTYIVKNKSKLKAIADWVHATDNQFYYGAGDRILATYYAKAPAAFGGDLTKAKKHFDQSLAIEPNYLGTKVLMAQYYATKKQDPELFRQLLEEVLAADPNSIPELYPEQKLDQANAQKLLDKVDDLF